MECVAASRLIHRSIDGELGYLETSDFQRHLSFCAECSTELRELSAVRGTLAAWGRVDLAPSPGFADRVVDAVGREPLPGAPRPLGSLLADTMRRVDRVLGKVPLPGGGSIPVSNIIGAALGVTAVLIALLGRGQRRENDVRVS